MSKEGAASDTKGVEGPIEVGDARPSFELPLLPGMQPLVEPSRERRVAPVVAPTTAASSTGAVAHPPAHTDPAVDVGFDPYALDASPLDALPGLELEDVPRAPRAPVRRETRRRRRLPVSTAT